MNSTCPQRKQSALRCQRHYRIGRINISVQSDYPEALDDFEYLYSDFRTDQPGPNSILMQAKADRRSFLGRRRYTIYGDGTRIFGPRKATEVFPYLEWGINWRVVQRHANFLQLHAATLRFNNRTMVFAGNSGSGKSTLAAGLLARRWQYFGDEFALIDPESFLVHPFPKAVCVKSGSFDIVRRMNLALWRRRHYSKDFKGPIGYINPRVGNLDLATQPSPIDCIIFPKYSPDHTPRLQPIARSVAAFELARRTFNPSAWGNRLMPLLCDLIRRADCYYLESGPLETTTALLKNLAATH